MKEQIIEWMTGIPEESGSYLITVDGYFVTVDYYSTLRGWSYWEGRITAWRKLRDIKPYNGQRNEESEG